jgi:hypothetical protein
MAVVAVSFAVFVFALSAVTISTAEPGAVALTLIEIGFDEASGATVPTAQLTLLPLALGVQPALAETKVIPLGKSSVREMPVASAGPVFVTTIT